MSVASCNDEDVHRPIPLASCSGFVSSRVYGDLFCRKIESSPDGALAKLCFPWTPGQVRTQLERRDEVQGRHVYFSLLSEFRPARLGGTAVTTWTETGGMYAEARSRTSRHAVRGELESLQTILDRLLKSAADPQYGGPRELTVVRKELTVERERAMAAIYAEPDLSAGIHVGVSDVWRRVLLTDEGIIGTIGVGKDRSEGTVVEAQLVRAPGAAQDHAASPDQVAAVVDAVTQWAVGHTISGRHIQLRTAATRQQELSGAWIS